MLGNNGDELTNMWGLIGVGVAVGSVGLTLSHRLWRYAFLIIGAIFILFGFCWSPIRTAAPVLEAAVTGLTSNLQNWFVVIFVLVMALWLHQWRKELVVEVRKPKPLGPDTSISTPELRQVLEAEIVDLNSRINTRLSALEGIAIPRSEITVADDETRKLAGRLNYLVEYALRGRFEYPPNYTQTEGLYYNDLMNSTHLIWTEDRPKKLRREFDAAMLLLSLAYTGKQSLSGPTAEKKKLEEVAGQLVAILKG